MTLLLRMNVIKYVGMLFPFTKLKIILQFFTKLDQNTTLDTQRNFGEIILDVNIQVIQG